MFQLVDFMNLFNYILKKDRESLNDSLAKNVFFLLVSFF